MGKITILLLVLAVALGGPLGSPLEDVFWIERIELAHAAVGDGYRLAVERIARWAALTGHEDTF